MYQVTLQNNDGLEPIIALISHENRLTPKDSSIKKFLEQNIFFYHKTMRLQYIQ